MDKQEARDRAIVDKAIEDAKAGKYSPPEPHGVDRAFGAVLTLGLSELSRDDHAQEIYDAAHSARRG